MNECYSCIKGLPASVSSYEAMWHTFMPLPHAGCSRHNVQNEKAESDEA
jgi:hypothetical protein